MQKLELEYLSPIAPSKNAVFDYRIRVAEASGAPISSEPIAVWRTKDDDIPITGHSRIGYAYRSGAELPALIYPASTEPQDLIDLSLRHTRSSLTAVEKIVAVYKTFRFCEERCLVCEVPTTAVQPIAIPEPLLDSYTELLGRKVSSRFLGRLFDVVTYSLGELTAMNDLGLTIEQIIPLLDLSRKEREAYLRVRATHQLSTGETKKIAEHLIFLRGRKTFSLDRWSSAVTGGDSANFGGAGIVASLEETRNPKLSEQRARIEALIRRLGLPNTARITPPEHLEGNALSCYFRFSQSSELAAQIDKLRRAIDSGLIDELFETLNEE